MNVGIVFKKPHLAWLWGSQLGSVIGDHLFTVALTWLAVVASGSSAAYLTAAGTGTALLLRLFGGALADRWNRRLVMIRVDILRALIVGVLPLIDRFVGLKLWHLVVAVVLVEALGTLFDPAMQASLPELCGDPVVLQTTNALMDGTQRLARVLGPGLTGAFLLVLALPHFFAVDAVTFCVSALVLLFLKRHFAHPRANGQEHATETVSLLADIGHSFRLLLGHRKLRFALACLGIVNIAWSAVYATGIPLLASQRLSGSIGAYGLLVGAYGVGNVVSLLVMGWLPFRMNLLMMFVGELLLGGGYFLLGSATSVPLAMCECALAAFGSPMGDLILLAMIQTDFPPEHIGKMYSLRQLISGLGLLVGSLLAVPVFQRMSITAGIQRFACLIGLVGLVGIVRFARLDKKPVLKTTSKKKTASLR